MDRLSKDKRSQVMSRIRGTDTKNEIKVRKALFNLGYRFRKNDKRYPGKPDIVLPKYQSVIFVHGCFWHQHPGCKKATIPKKNAEFWKKKLEGNRKRDIQHISDLTDAGWRVLVIWECQTRDIDVMSRIIEAFLDPGSQQ